MELKLNTTFKLAGLLAVCALFGGCASFERVAPWSAPGDEELCDMSGYLERYEKMEADELGEEHGWLAGRLEKDDNACLRQRFALVTLGLGLGPSGYEESLSVLKGFSPPAHSGNAAVLGWYTGLLEDRAKLARELAGTRSDLAVARRATAAIAREADECSAAAAEAAKDHEKKLGELDAECKAREEALTAKAAAQEKQLSGEVENLKGQIERLKQIENLLEEKSSRPGAK